LRYGNPDDAVFPFLEQNRLVNEYLLLCKSNPHPASQSFLLANIEEALHNCNQSIQWIREQRIAYGTSLAQTYILTRLEQLIGRQFLVLDLLDPDSYFNLDRFVDYFKCVVQNENRKHSIREFLSQKASHLAHQISEHGGRTAEQFVSTTGRNSGGCFQSAMGGGIIISFISISKNLLGKMPIAPFWLGFLNSANYSLGFILIQDTGSTLAAKQPAFTTNKLASSLDAQTYRGRT
jgi:site-specific recombinase